MFGNGLNRQFGWSAVEKANRLLKGWMEFPISMVGRTRNAGYLSKLDGTSDQSAQSRVCHTGLCSRFTEGRSIPDCFHRPQIAQKAFPLLFIQARSIKRGK